MIQKERTCGDCVACCVYLNITDPKLNKRAMSHCPHLLLPGEESEGSVYYTGENTCGNCSVYGTDKKPECCTDYYCAWRLGHGDEEDRPDKSLMLFDRLKGVENALEAKPLKDGQEGTEEGKAIIDRMSSSAGTPVIVLDFYERRVVRIAGRSVDLGWVRL
jgi:hypothetical protein